MPPPSPPPFVSQVAALRATKASPAKSRAVVVTQAKKDERGVYIGKGKWVQDDESKYAARDNWFTGGWPGGEVGLKDGDYVQIKKKSGGFFGFLGTITGGPAKTGTVKKVEADKSGKVQVSVSVLPFDNVVVFSGDELEKIDAN